MGQELIEALELNGIVVECESPLEIYREDLGRATGEFALFITHACYDNGQIFSVEDEAGDT